MRWGNSMNRLLLPAGLLLAALAAADSVFEQHLRLVELERAPVLGPEQLIALRNRVESERAKWSEELEARWAEERELEAQRARFDQEEMARLKDKLLEQRAALEEQSSVLAQWESNWSELSPTVIQRRLFELQTRLETQSSDLEIATRKDQEDLQRVHRNVRDLATKLDSSLAAPDTERLWGDLVGPVVQLIGDSTVGSGVLLESRPLLDGGYATNILTAWHVVRDIYGKPDNTTAPVPVKVYAPDGTWHTLSAHLLVRDVALDLALLLVDTKESLPFGARLAPRNELEGIRPFDAVYAVGCPLGNDPIPTVGEVATTHHEIDGEKYWMISAPTYIGNSGGGIYAARSHDLVGIFSKIYTHGSTRSTIVPHMGLMTPLSVVYDWLDTTEYAYLEAKAPAIEAQTAAARR